jgi:predicted PurR-regulated permease PerM
MAILENPTNITITTGTIWRGIFAVLLIVLIYFLRDIVLIILTSVVIASAVEPLAVWGKRYKIPRTLTVIVVYVLIAGAILSLLIIFMPPVVTEFIKFADELPEKLSSFDFSNLLPGQLGEIESDSSFFEGLSFDSLADSVQNFFGSLSKGLFGAVSTIFGGALSFVLILVLSFYLSVQEKGIENFIRVVTPINKEAYLVSLWRRSQAKIGKWIQGQFILGLIIGILVYLGLRIFTDIEYVLLLAVLAGLFEIIPVFGPIIAAVPALILGFAISPGTGLVVFLIYVIIQQFENHLIYPLVVTKIVGVPPLLVIIALVVGAKIAGFLGIILSVPAAAVLVEILHDIEKEKAILLGEHHHMEEKQS